MENNIELEEQLISFETAKLAKEKGFNMHCRNIYGIEGESWYMYENEDFPYNSLNDSLFAPTQSLLQKWIRDKFDIHLQIVICFWSIRKYQYIVHSETCHKKSSQYLGNAIFGSYEEVLEFGLKKCLKLIK